MMDKFFFRKRHSAIGTYPNPRVMAYHCWHDKITGQYALMILGEMIGVGPVEYQCWVNPDLPVEKEGVISHAAELSTDAWNRIDFIDSEKWLADDRPLETKWAGLSEAMTAFREALEEEGK